jgi:hypothetical protein
MWEHGVLTLRTTRDAGYGAEASRPDHGASLEADMAARPLHPGLLPLLLAPPHVTTTTADKLSTMVQGEGPQRCYVFSPGSPWRERHRGTEQIMHRHRLPFLRHHLRCWTYLCQRQIPRRCKKRDVELWQFNVMNLRVDLGICVSIVIKDFPKAEICGVA